jgi:oligopeptide/dipeptide ABC transporter ATP-binding protein
LTLLEVDGLRVDIDARAGRVPVLVDVSLSLGEGETLGLVGESGSGKSMTIKAIARLLPRGATVSGSIRFDGEDVLAMDSGRLRAYRTSGIANVFQDPRAAINPVRTVGDFMTEAMIRVLGRPAAEARRRAVELLAEVGIEDGERRLRQYPHQLSGGLLQRAMIAAALAMEPRLLLADEPTTALDVTTQSEVMAIVDELRRRRRMALLFVTHDLDLASAVCDRTAVMYAGSIVAEQPSATLHDDPLHPYAAALIRARPSAEGRMERLQAISGRPLSAAEVPSGCAFAPRCAFAAEACTSDRIAIRQVDDGRVRCVRAADLRGRLTERAEA